MNPIQLAGRTLGAVGGAGGKADVISPTRRTALCSTQGKISDVGHSAQLVRVMVQPELGVAGKLLTAEQIVGGPVDFVPKLCRVLRVVAGIDLAAGTVQDVHRQGVAGVVQIEKDALDHGSFQ